MANLYVRSTDGSDADNGTTWALAKATIGGAAAIDSTTDRTIMVSDNHAETPSGSTTWAWAGISASPTIVRCADDSAEPPTATASTATVTCDASLTLSGSGLVLFDGLSFVAGNGSASVANLHVMGSGTGGRVCMSRGSLSVSTSNASGTISWVNASAPSCSLSDVDFKFGATGHGFSLNGTLDWDGGALLSGGTSPTTLVTAVASGSEITLTGIDLTNAGSGINLFSSTSNNISVICRDWKMPNSWSGSFHSGTPGRGSRFSFYNCDSADSQNRMAIHTIAGVIVSETTIVRTGGASDGTSSLSWKLISNADAEWPVLSLDSDEITVWNGTTGSAVTVTVEMVTDNVTLQDDDIEVAVTYMGTSGRPLAAFTTSGNSNTLSAGSNYTTSSETWTTTGLTTPVKQYMSVSFTPEEVGVIHAVVRLYKASTTVYVCPKLTLS